MEGGEEQGGEAQAITHRYAYAVIAMSRLMLRERGDLSLPFALAPQKRDKKWYFDAVARFVATAGAALLSVAEPPLPLRPSPHPPGAGVVWWCKSA